MSNEEIVTEFERRFPYDCFVCSVEMNIRDILEEIRRIERGQPTRDEELTQK